jgi:FtsP/CotA-like multicopper oxidase with cupredoxin domain
MALFIAMVGVTAVADEGEGDFRKLPEVVSQNGVLSVTLTAEPKTITLDGVKLEALTFNGEYGGPVLRLKPGDRLKIHLLNRIDKPINLHFHGSHGSPGGNGDNVHIVVKPGESFDYRINFPKSQPPGLYYYHTHIHGLAEEEVNRGLSGAIIIDGVETRVPETATARARLLVLKAFSIDRPDDPAVKRLHGVVQSINGEAHAEIRAKAGASEFWRISNQSPNDYYHLSAKGLHFRIVGLDGVPTAHDLPVDKLDIPPAGRVEVMVDMPAAGSYTLLSGSMPTGVGRAMTSSRELATIKVEGEMASRASVPAPSGERVLSAGYPICHAPSASKTASGLSADLHDAKIDARRLIRFSQKPDEEVYLINDKVFDHQRIDTRVPLGSIEEWTIRNDTDDMHVFHIHQIHFQVMAINGQPQPFDRLLDTVRVPERGEVTLRMAFTDPRIIGRFMYHCHVLKHEDKGMMANIEVYDPKRPRDGEAHHHLD